MNICLPAGGEREPPSLGDFYIQPYTYIHTTIPPIYAVGKNQYSEGHHRVVYDVYTSIYVYLMITLFIVV